MVIGQLSATRLDRSAWANARWLVIAPHADDETIGAGALITYAARRGTLASVVFVTDGAGSHPHVDDSARRSHVALRRREAERAMRRLAPRSAAPRFLGWPDATPPDRGGSVFLSSLRRTAALCRRLRIDAVAVTAAHEPHCDHVAACALAYALQDKATRPIAVFEYVVWADGPPGDSHRVLRTPSRPAGPRRLALAAHRSQLTPLHGEGFRLPARHMRTTPFDLLYLKVRRHDG